MNEPDAVQTALGSGADVDSKWGTHGKTALMHAMSDASTQSDIQQHLIDRGAMVGRTDKDGWNVCHWVAASCNNALWIRLVGMASKGQANQLAEAMKKPDAFGRTPLHVACQNAEDSDKRDTTKFIQRLLKVLSPSELATVPAGSTARVGSLRFNGWSALHFAAAQGSYEAVAALLADKRVTLELINLKSLSPGYRTVSSEARSSAPEDQLTAFELAARNLHVDEEQLEEADPGAFVTQVEPEDANRVLGALITRVLELGGGEAMAAQLEYLAQCSNGRAAITAAKPELLPLAKNVAQFFEDKQAGRATAESPPPPTEKQQLEPSEASQQGAAKEEGGCSCVVM